MKNLLLSTTILFLFTASLFAQKAETYEQFQSAASDSFAKKADALDEEFKLGDYDQWDFQQDTRQIVFSDKGVKKVIANVQIVGSWATNGTWMWAWDNKTIDDSLKKAANKALQYGKEKKFEEMTTPTFSANTDYGWTLTAMTGHLTRARGTYRGENNGGYVFFLITDIKWVK